MFELTLKNGAVVPLRFTNWSLKRFSEIQKLNINEAIQKIFASVDSSSTDAVFLDLPVTYALLQACYENATAFRDGKPATVSEFTVSEWVEDSGIYGAGVIEFYTYVIKALTVHFGKQEKEATEAPNA
jgi:hypothetical protein